MPKTNWKKLYLEELYKRESFEHSYNVLQEENLALLCSDVVIHAKTWMLKDTNFLKNIRAIFVGSGGKLYLGGDTTLTGRLVGYGGSITFGKTLTLKKFKDEEDYDPTKFPSYTSKTIEPK